MRQLFKSFSLVLVLSIIVLYALNDAWNSGNTGASDSNRGIVYVLLISVIVAMGFFIFIHPIKFHRPGYLAMMFILTAWIFLENFLAQMGGWIRFVHFFLAIWWLVSFYYFYIFLRVRPNFDKAINKFFFILMCLYMGITVYAYLSITAIRGSDFNAVLNYSYSILVFVPFTFLFPQKICKISLLVIFGLLVFSLKRGPLIIFPLMYLAYVYSKSAIEGRPSSFIGKMLLFIIAFGIAFYIGDQLTDGFLSHRFDKQELENGSNRSMMYEIAYNNIKNRDFMTLLIGTGSGSSIELLGTGVHNEWLEFLFTFGIIGVILYFIFGVTVFRRYRFFLRKKSPYSPILGALTVFFWTIGMFSGFYFSHTSFYFFSCLGVIEALDYNRRKCIYK